jgi:hypothetical protein
MTVAELIAYLQTQPQDLPVAYYALGEHMLLEASYIDVYEAGEPQPDGWIYTKSLDKPSVTYLVFPGN